MKHDLFLQDVLLGSAKAELVRIINETAQLDIVSIVGVPLTVCGKLYNCSVVINKGKAIGAAAKRIADIGGHTEKCAGRYT